MADHDSLSLGYTQSLGRLGGPMAYMRDLAVDSAQLVDARRINALQNAEICTAHSLHSQSENAYAFH